MMNFQSNRTAIPHQQIGVSLIEVLISVLVLGIGLLGAAALQSSGLRHANTSQMEIRAQLLAQDLAEMIMAFDTKADGVYDIDVPDDTPQKDCEEELCDAEAMAKHNLWLWDQNMQPKLPSYELNIDFDTTTDAVNGTTNTYTIIMTWDADRKGDDYEASTCTAADSMHPGCLALQFNIRG